MKTVITTVGTSIFTNYKKGKKDLDDKVRDLESLSYAKWNKYEDDIELTLKTMNAWAHDDSSAEIKSLIKIQEKLSAPLNVILLTTDTVMSHVAAEIIKKYFTNNKDISIEDKIIRVEYLQVENYSKFTEGMDNLVREVRKLLKNEFDKEDNNPKKAFDNIADNYIFNVLGGYKIIIPIMNIISQIYRIRSFYIFEGSNDLMENALLPLGFDDFFLEKLYFSIDKLKNQKDYSEQNSEIKGRLKTAKFVLKNKVTGLGELFYDYVFYNREISRSVLGYFAEYKLYEYFIESKQYECIEHSHTENGKRELDFVLNNDIIAEVKPAASFLNDKKVDKIREQIRGQINQYQNYKEHYLYLYTSDKNSTSNNQKIDAMIKKLYLELNRSFPNIQFSAFEVYWPLREKDDNPYKAFMKHKLTDKDIIPIKI